MPYDAAPADTLPEHPDHVPATGAALRSTLRHIASPVVIVAVQTDAGPRGATIGSFASVSLDPPLVSFNVTHETQLHEALVEAGRFAVQFLTTDQADLATHFATPDLSGAEQFATVAHTAAPGEPPRLDGVLATLVCTTATSVEAGDHTVFVGAVEAIVAGRDASPLLYYGQSYRGIGGLV